MRQAIIEPELSYLIVGAFYTVYNELGFGFVEAVYKRALLLVLRERGAQVQTEVPVDVWFRGHRIGAHRLDMLVGGRVVLELKASERLPAIAMRQVRNYLKAANLELGIVLHFGPTPAYHRVLAPGRLGGHRADSPRFGRFG